MSDDYREYAFHLPKRNYKVTNLNTLAGMNYSRARDKRNEKKIDDESDENLAEFLVPASLSGILFIARIYLYSSEHATRSRLIFFISLSVSSNAFNILYDALVVTRCTYIV